MARFEPQPQSPSTDRRHQVHQSNLGCTCLHYKLLCTKALMMSGDCWTPDFDVRPRNSNSNKGRAGGGGDGNNIFAPSAARQMSLLLLRMRTARRSRQLFTASASGELSTRQAPDRPIFY